MRKTIPVSVLLLLVGALMAQAQGFIPEKDKQEREAEEMRLARKLLESKDSHERVKIRDEMIEKDVIRNAGGQALGNGFSVKAFVWLYGEGKDDRSKDLNARLHAVIGLAFIDSAAARLPLITTLEDPNDAIQLRAIQAISRRSIVRAGKDVVLKLRSPNPEVVAAAAKCLTDLGVTEGSTGTMIELMVQWYAKLLKAADDDPERVDHHRMIEVLGRACGQLTGVKWSPGPSIEDLGAEIAKLTRWWNQQHLTGLKDPRHEVRKDALDRMSVTADRSVFMPVLEAVVKEFTRLQATGNFTEKQQAQQFIVV
ncbi:MAG TPA: HEAT repeat domain-containing protein, partial [Planctomycetota bacterium]|nr:HEAT repeat domain-containing protein [Planctomycetota bacterium]